VGRSRGRLSSDRYGTTPEPDCVPVSIIAVTRFNAMTVRLTRNEIQLLKELAAAGEHGRVMRPLTSSARSGIAHLMSAQYIKRRWHTRLYMITERGREALIETTAEQG